LQGAEVLFYPTAIGWHPQEKSNMAKPAWRLDECDESMPLQMAFMLRSKTVLV
jgi:hypothetical protein